MLQRPCVEGLVAAALIAQDRLPLAAAAHPQGTPLRVAFSEVPPFVIKDSDGSWRGISVDLWSGIARPRGYEYELLPMAFKDVLPSLEAGDVGAAEAALAPYTRRPSAAARGGRPQACPTATPGLPVSARRAPRKRMRSNRATPADTDAGSPSEGSAVASPGPARADAWPSRRRWLRWLPAVGAAAGAAGVAAQSAGGSAKPERMPGDPPEHRVVYQLNHAEPDHIEHILNSVGAMIGKYADNVAIAVVAFGPGIHLLGKVPRRPVPQPLRERARSQARDYGVRFIACGNTMKTLDWTAADLEPYAVVEPVGAAALMELQEQGWAYIAW